MCCLIPEIKISSLKKPKYQTQKKANKKPQTTNQTELKRCTWVSCPVNFDKCPLSFFGVIILGLKSTVLYEIEGHWGPEILLVKSDLWLPCQSLLGMFAVVSIYGTVSVSVSMCGSEWLSFPQG